MKTRRKSNKWKKKTKLMLIKTMMMMRNKMRCYLLCKGSSTHNEKREWNIKNKKQQKRRRVTLSPWKITAYISLFILFLFWRFTSFFYKYKHDLFFFCFVNRFSFSFTFLFCFCFMHRFLFRILCAHTGTHTHNTFFFCSFCLLLKDISS